MTGTTFVFMAATVSAHTATPCNDTNGDGQPSGQEYAQHHIVPLAQAHELGHDGHTPGAHHGFSVCK
ncbi:hypothetical protein ACJROX_13240 [Pseudalkalibacillus sp. A8]|uniref:hypothetical protein n=1 Tax=Pseudalkalibacillus sp. A8 TaxID=3382641 RepID=UPI0038B4A58D